MSVRHSLNESGVFFSVNELLVNYSLIRRFISLAHLKNSEEVFLVHECINNKETHVLYSPLFTWGLFIPPVETGNELFPKSISPIFMEETWTTSILGLLLILMQ